MRTRIILGAASLTLLVIAMVVVSAGSGAWFSDTETSTGNTFAAGTLLIGASVDQGDAILLANLEPVLPESGAWTRVGTVTITNEGSLPLRFRMWLEHAPVPNDLDEHLLARAVFNEGQGATPEPLEWYGAERELCAGISIRELYNHGNPYLAAPNFSPAAPDMEPGRRCTITLYVLLPGPETGNEHQGVSYTAALHIYATQPEGYSVIP
ncbi:MAG TPA: SipW-dependent-type signal peptide-containing protein [Anaerolineae bacterium]|nr:SipW-dependent-type signal peptide-containing protein [Anaerolineae bacterium]HOR00517.1 SipW-dependent-type signal peptide-containing protein [Anaerolineae bacterium]